LDIADQTVNEVDFACRCVHTQGRLTVNGRCFKLMLRVERACAWAHRNSVGHQTDTVSPFGIIDGCIASNTAAMAGCKILVVAVWAITLVILSSNKRVEANIFKGCKREPVAAHTELLTRQELVILACTSV
jgi:hypothetical protein